MTKKVTILIPVYNGANYVREAIDSALGQTYKNIEIIVVNDGSNDNGKTDEILRSYGDKIKYIKKENGGVSSALNLGIKEASGDYISWLSHDDIYYPDKVAYQINALKDYDDNTILYSDFDLIDENGVKFCEVHLEHDLLEEKYDYAVLLEKIGGITLLIPKKAFDEVGEFDVDLRCTQDYDMWFRMLDKYKFRHLKKTLTATRIHKMQDTFTSPKMISEGNSLWIKIINNYPVDKKIKSEGSEYLFYKKMEESLSSRPYLEALENVKNKADASFKKIKDSIKKLTVSVIVIDNGCRSDLEKTCLSINEQSINKLDIIIQGSSKYKNYLNTKNYDDSIKKVKSNYYVFINAGVRVKENWLENMLVNALLTKKGAIISDYPNSIKHNLIDNYCALLTSIDGVLIDSKYKVKYEYDYQFLYDIAKLGGSFIIDEEYLMDRVLSYDMELVYKYLGRILNDGLYRSVDMATLNYDISCIFNKYSNSQDKVYMYEPNDEYRELMFSRSFRLLKKYIDIKKKRSKKI